MIAEKRKLFFSFLDLAQLAEKGLSESAIHRVRECTAEHPDCALKTLQRYIFWGNPAAIFAEHMVRTIVKT